MDHPTTPATKTEHETDLVGACLEVQVAPIPNGIGWVFRRWVERHNGIYTGGPRRGVLLDINQGIWSADYAVYYNGRLVALADRHDVIEDAAIEDPEERVESDGAVSRLLTRFSSGCVTTGQNLKDKYSKLMQRHSRKHTAEASADTPADAS